MNRRQLMKGAIVGAGTAVAGGVGGAPHAAHHAPASPASQKATDSWKPLLFDPHQNETVVALADLIIPATDTPGAKAAQVNRFIDLILNESSAETQRKFLQGLAWLDGYALRTHGAPFVRCTPEQQIEMLRRLDPGDHPPSELGPGQLFFREIKRRTISGYYTSKVGWDELNKGGRVPATFGCPHDGHG